MKKISVIIPVYNREEYLERCVKSVVNQSYENLEIILVNDGSTDNSGAMCDELAKGDSRISVVHKENGGLSSARNAGIEVSTGDYLAFVDGDDWIANDMYEYLLDLSEKYDADICGADLVFTSNINYRPKEKKVTENVYEGDEKLIRYLTIGMQKMNNQYSACNKLYRKELFEDIRFPLNQHFEDVATNYSLLEKANRFVVSDKQVYFYYQGSSSITRKKFQSSDFDLIKVGKDILEISKGKGKMVMNYAKMYYAGTYFSLLLKIKLFGLDENFKDLHKVDMLKERLVKYYPILKKSKLPLYRKIVIFMMIKCDRLLDIPFYIVFRSGLFF